MEEKILWDLYCFQCSLQFEKNSNYDMHLLIIHNYKNGAGSLSTLIKDEPEEFETSSNIQSKQTGDRKLTKSVISANKGKKSFKCDKSFAGNDTKDKHVSSVHRRKKPFQCKTCDFSSSQKSSLNVHVASVHEGKKPFRCKNCDYICSQKSTLKLHVA